MLHQVNAVYQLQNAVTQGYQCLVEADVLEEVVLVVMADRLDEWQCLLHAAAAAELNFSHHAELWWGRVVNTQYSLCPLYRGYLL